MVLRQQGGRLAAEDLIEHTPVQMPLLGLSAWLATAATFLFAWAVAGALLLMLGRWWLLGLILVVPPTMYWWSACVSIARGRINRGWFNRQWQDQTVTVAPVHVTCRVDEAIPGTWICRRASYRQQNSDYRQLVGNAAPRMEATYKLLVASLREDGNQQFMCFSDGSVENWVPREKVHVFRDPLPRYGYRNEDPSIADAARAFESFARKLDASPATRWYVRHLMEAVAEFYESAAIADAFRALQWWGFVVVDGSTDEPTAAITDAGRVWVESDPSRQPSRTGVSRVKERRRSEPTFSFGTNFGVINIGHNIKGNKTTINTSPPSDAELLMALAAVLRREDIPWKSAGLSDVREEIEDAIAERDPHRGDLKKAIPKLLGTCGELAIGLGSDAIFEILKHYVS